MLQTDETPPPQQQQQQKRERKREIQKSPITIPLFCESPRLQEGVDGTKIHLSNLLSTCKGRMRRKDDIN